MELNVITPNDLIQFRKSLIEEISLLLSKNKNSEYRKKWGKTKHITDLFSLSTNYLNELRKDGIIPYSSFKKDTNGDYWYEIDAVHQILKENEIKPNQKLK